MGTLLSSVEAVGALATAAILVVVGRPAGVEALCGEGKGGKGEEWGAVTAAGGGIEARGRPVARTHTHLRAREGEKWVKLRGAQGLGGCGSGTRAWCGAHRGRARTDTGF